MRLVDYTKCYIAQAMYEATYRYVFLMANEYIVSGGIHLLLSNGLLLMPHSNLMQYT